MKFKKVYLWGLLVIPGALLFALLFRTGELKPTVKEDKAVAETVSKTDDSQSEEMATNRFHVLHNEIENLRKSKEDAGEKFLSIMERVCEGDLCLPPDREQDPKYQLSKKERDIFLREKNLRKGIGPKDFVLSPERRKELLGKLSEFINQDTEEMNPGIYAANILNDLSQGPVAMNVKREYELNQLNDTLISRWVELDDFQELNHGSQVVDDSMLDAELLAVYRYRRMLVDEKESRENLKKEKER
jgi:hypothetical protein